MNRGAEKLRELLAERGAPARLARDLGVDPAVLSHWMSGSRAPDTKYRAKLEDTLGIGWRLWDDQLDAEPDTERAQ